MPLPGWVIQQAHEERVAAEKAFQEWCEVLEQEYAVTEFYVRTPPKHIRSKRYFYRKK